MSEQLSGLRKFMLPEIIFGLKSRALVGQYCRNFSSKKVLLVSDKGVTEAGWTEEVINSLNSFNKSFAVFDSVSPNPRVEEIMDGAEFFKMEKCDTIVAIGGGSALDCAKGIGIVASNGGTILDYEGVDKIYNPLPPMIFIPTTSGTSADVSQFCIVSNKEKLIKIAIVSKAIIPDVALIDPETTLTMDDYLTVCTGMDAMVHAIEAYVSIANSPLTDMHALDAIRLLAKNLPIIVKNPLNIDVRTNIMLASAQAGFAFSNASLGAVHAMAHSLGGFLDLPHGECNALLLEYVMDYNFEAVPERYLKIAEIFGIRTDLFCKNNIRKVLFDFVHNFRINLGINGSLKDRGVKLSDIPALAANAFNDACLYTNPRVMKQSDIEELYEKAF